MSVINFLYKSLIRIRNSPELRKSVFYLGGSTLGYGIVFVQNFSLAFFSSVSFFGKITVIISLFSTLYVLFTFGLNAVILRFYFDKNYSDNKTSFISQVSGIWMLCGLALIATLLPVGYWGLVDRAYLPINYFSDFIPVLLGAFLFSFSEIFPNLFIVEEKPKHYAVCLITSRLAIFTFLHLSLYLFGESVSHISFMLFLAGATVAVVGVLIFRVFPLQKLDKVQLKMIFNYSFPLMIYALGGIGYSHGYRVIISNALSNVDLAIYTLSNHIALVYYLTATSCITGFYPKAYKALEENGGDRKAISFYLRMLTCIGIGLVIVVLPAALLFLKHFKQGSYLPGFEILPIQLFGQFIYFMYSYSYIQCTYLKATKILTLSMSIGVITSIILAAVLLPEYKLWGATMPVVTGLVIQLIVSQILINYFVRRRTDSERISI